MALPSSSVHSSKLKRVYKQRIMYPSDTKHLHHIFFHQIYFLCASLLRRWKVINIVLVARHAIVSFLNIRDRAMQRHKGICRMHMWRSFNQDKRNNEDKKQNKTYKNRFRVP
jgi:hypothetical protein